MTLAVALGTDPGHHVLPLRISAPTHSSVLISILPATTDTCSQNSSIQANFCYQLLWALPSPSQDMTEQVST